VHLDGWGALARKLAGMLSRAYVLTTAWSTTNLILSQIIQLLKCHGGAAAADYRRGAGGAGLRRMLGGLVFSAKSLQPKFSKLNPLPGKRLFSAQTVGAGQSHLKSVLMGSVAGFYLWHHWPEMMRLISESPVTAMSNALNLVGLCALLVVLALSRWWVLTSSSSSIATSKTAHVASGYP
jgi:flagellar biosynthetic protein FlhB